jgi:hypothetical protein
MGPGALEHLALSGSNHHFIKVIDQTGILTGLSGSEASRAIIYWSVAGLLVAFIAGLMTRITYPIFVALFWLAICLQPSGHWNTPLLLALVATIPAPWGERWSLDSLLRGNFRRPLLASPFYGYAIWLLGLTIGLTYTTAGLSKLVVTEGRWLWETGARNGFIQDLAIAATDWGMILTNNYVLALGASVISAFGQGVYVWSCFTRSPLVKYAIAFGIAFPFLIGLVLFMGHFWWCWAILIVMLYVPWTAIDRGIAGKQQSAHVFGGTPREDRHRRWFLSATGLLISLHAFAVVSKTEYEPLYSNYKMYAEGMPAGSAHEAAFWSKYKTYNRNHQFAIRVLGPDSVVDLGPYYHLAWNLTRAHLWRLDAVKLNPSLVFKSFDAGLPIKRNFCETLRTVASSYAVSGPARAIRFAKRYYDMVDGQMVWVPVTSWVEVSLSEQGCSYKVVEG